MLINKFDLLEEKHRDLAEWNPSIFPHNEVIFTKLQKSLFTGIGSMVHDLFVFERMEKYYDGADIYIKLKVLKRNSYQFKTLAELLFKLRNIVIHHGILTIDLIQNITISLIELFKENLIFWSNKSFNMFYNQWISIYNKILSQYIPDSMAIEEIMPFRLKMMSLRYYRDNGYREMLVGKSIKILSGKWQGYTSILSKWKGTCVYFLFNEVRIGIPIDTLIETI
jgi:hypothetical protein